MEYKIVEREPFKLIAKTRQFKNEIVNDDTNHDIPDFWEENIEAGLIPELKKMAASDDIYGACAALSKEIDTFAYGIGVQYDGDAVPDGYRLWEVKPTLWGVFPCYGKDAECVRETWKKIFGEFLPGSGYDMLDEVDFEFYPAEKEREDLFCEIRIPIGKKR
ncbi:MAG: effector binding domain-containing protein [Anaerolineaceae bacterium]|nr:effector binding domain-containing protein [Anaerolineaceae bacterium]